MKEIIVWHSASFHNTQKGRQGMMTLVSVQNLKDGQCKDHRTTWCNLRAVKQTMGNRNDIKWTLIRPLSKKWFMPLDYMPIDLTNCMRIIFQQMRNKSIANDMYIIFTTYPKAINRIEWRFDMSCTHSVELENIRQDGFLVLETCCMLLP